MTVADDIRAIQAASMKRTGASLVEIAKFWNLDSPLSRQRISQLVKKGERLLARRDNPLYPSTLNRDEPITEDIAYRLGMSGRLARIVTKLALTPREVDHFLISRRDALVNYPGFGIKSFNELAYLFGRKQWSNKYLGKAKYNRGDESAVKVA